MIVALPTLCWRCAEHDQFPMADFVEPEDVHAIVMRSDFDVAIAGSVPLTTISMMSTRRPPSGRCSEIGMRLDLNGHELTHGITRSRRSNLRACCSLHATTKSLRSR